MKKTVIFFISILIIVSFVSYKYIGYKITAKKAQNENYQYASYDGKEIYGTDLATLINRAVDDNKKNNIENNRIQQFNSHFTTYVGDDNVTIYDIITMANLATQNNQNYNFQKRTTVTGNDNYISVKIR